MSFDVAVIGSGPGGYVAAIRCSQLGFKTALVERYNTLGGTCLNVGCIPSKALLDSSEHFYNASHTFETHGIDLKNLKVNMPQMIKRKSEVVDQNVQGIAFLMKKNKIEVFHGHGSFKDASTLLIDGKQELKANNFIIATGSKPITPAPFNYDKNRVITSTEALNIDKLPKKMVVIGAGVIGLELGSVFLRLGTEVEVVEYMDRVLPGMDKDCARELKKVLKKQGMKFHLSHKVTSVKGTKTKAVVEFEKVAGGDAQKIEADYCLIAIGRRAYTDNLGLENVGVQTDERGKIIVDNHLRTSAANIYAIGDVINGAMLAHKAEEEGVFVAEQLAGQIPHIDHNLIPGVVYTWPEVSAVGKTEEQLKEEGIPYKKGKFSYKALGRARASMDTDGLVKILAHEETDEVLGVHITGARAADMIMEAVALMEFRATAEDMARICHPHPTYTEAVKEAALAATDDRAIHA